MHNTRSRALGLAPRGVSVALLLIVYMLNSTSKESQLQNGAINIHLSVHANVCCVCVNQKYTVVCHWTRKVLSNLRSLRRTNQWQLHTMRMKITDELAVLCWKTELDYSQNGLSSILLSPTVSTVTNRTNAVLFDKRASLKSYKVSSILRLHQTVQCHLRGGRQN